jgi:hypothetical protein
MWAAALLSIHVQQLMVRSLASYRGSQSVPLVSKGAGPDCGALARVEASTTEIGESH